MKNRILHFTLNSFALLSAFLFTSIFISCGEDSGLGATIDTEAPKMAISYPNPKANNVAMGEFVLAGTCSDDKIVSRVEVAVTNLDSQKSYGSFPATVNAQTNTWSITFNTFDDSNGDNYNGYPFPDGSYQFVATAYDNVGHSTQDTSTLEIDNTAPVFVISKPGVVISDTKEESTRISKYGSVFSIEGTVAESHQVSKMDLQIYDESGNLVNTEPYEESEISTTGGTSVTIARFLEGGNEETNNRYNVIYGAAGSVADSDGNKRYSCTVTLSDNAKIFRHPGDDGVEKGNESSVVYLNDDIYDKYMSSKKGAGLSADDFRKVINKTATESDITGKGQVPVTLDDVASALKELAVDTSLQSGDNPLDTTLSFSINPNADPTYLVSGFNFKYTDFGDGVADSVKAATQNQGITVAVSCSLDGVKIKPSAFKVWMKDIGNSDDGVSSEEKVRDEIATLVDQVKIEEEDAAKEERNFDESVVSNGWLLLHDNSSDKAPSDTSVNINEDLPNTIEFNHYYIIAVTGKDTDDVYLSQSKLYGFVGNVSGTPPTISITSPEKTSPAEDPYVKSSDFAFEGTAEATTAGTNVKSLSLTLTVNDEGEGKGNAEIASLSASIDYDNKTDLWSSSDGFSCDYDGKLCQWTFNPSLHHEYEKIKAEEGAEKAYSYSISVTATSSTGLTATKDWNVHVDTVKPVVSLNSATPVVIGKDYYDDSDENYYLNGEIKISANAGDNAKLAKVNYDVWASCDLSKELTKDDSILDVLKTLAPDKVDGSLGTQSIISETFDTALITQCFERLPDAPKDPAIQIVMTITAEDMAGNTQTSSTKTIYDKFVIKQETDRPLVHFGNADPAITSSDDLSQDVNVFGTNSNNKLTLTLSDDDKINSYEITLYEADGKTLADTGDIDNPLTKAVGQTTASISYRLPEKEGEYQFKIVVRDFMPPSELSPDADKKHPYGKSEIGPFFIAVDAGAPEFKITKPQGKIEVKEAFAVSGSVVERSGSVTMSVTGSGTSAEYSSAKEIFETAGAGKTFSDTISLPEKDGEYTITYTARDKYGYYTQQTISYNVDTTEPTIESSSVSANEIPLSDGNFNSNYPLDIVVKANDETEDYAGTITEVAYSAYSGKVTETAGTPVIPWTPLTHKNDSYTGSASGFINANGGNGIEDGEYTLFIRATDSVGNKSALMPICLVADKTKPVLTTSSDPGSMSVDGSYGSYFEKGEFTIEGKLEEANLAEFYYSLNDGEEVSIPLDQGKWSIASGEIPEEGGTFAYIITAKDKAGSVTTLKRTVTIDKKAPQITIDEWKKSTTVVSYKNSETVTFSGTVKDEENGSGLAEVKVWYENASDKKFAKETVTANTSGEWTHTFTGIPEGSYTLHVLAKDNAGNEFEERKNFGIDLTKPESSLKATGHLYDNSNGSPIELSLSDLTSKWNDDLTYLANDSFTLSGSISDVAFRAKNVRLTVKKDGGAETNADLVLSKADGTEIVATDEIPSLNWSYEQTVKDVHLSDGVYTYKLSVTDDAGNSADYLFIVRLDTTAPSLTITSPVSGSNFKYAEGSDKAKITIGGTAFDSGSGSYKVYYDITKDGISVLKAAPSDKDAEASFVNENWSNSADIELSVQGNLVLQIKAEDYLGNETSRSVAFVCDSLPPELSDVKITTDKGQYDYYATTVLDLTATAIDAVSGVGTVTYSIDGSSSKVLTLSSGSSEAGQSGTYTASIVCPEGSHEILVTASDSNGNSVTASPITVKIDATKPEFGLTSLSKAVSKESVTLSGSISDSYGLLEVEGKTLAITAKKDGVAVTDLSNVISGLTVLESGKTLENAAWSFVVNADTENHSTDGNWVFTITAKDLAGNTDVTTTTVLIDTIAPAWHEDDENKFKLGGKAYDAENWYKATSLTAIGFFNEAQNGSGIKEISYVIKNAGGEEISTGTVDPNRANGIAKFQQDIENFENNSTIKFTVTDEAGNSSSSTEFTVKLDFTEPAPVMYDVDFTSVDHTNGKADKTVKFLVFDKESGLKEDAVSFSVGSKKNLNKDSDGVTVSITKITAENESTYKSEYKGSLESLVGYDLLSVSLNAEKYLSGLSGTLGITASLSDNAGNSWSGTVAQIELDTIAPKVTLSSASPSIYADEKTKVNKIVTLQGTASDSNTVTEVRLLASANGKEKLYYLTNGQTITYDSKNETTSGGISYNEDTKVWSCRIDTEYFCATNDEKDLSVTIVAKDSAGNWTGDGSDTAPNYAPPVTKSYVIAQDTDRPLVKINNLSPNGDSYILKYGTKAQVSGTISDDDSENTSVVTKLIISESEYKGQEGESEPENLATLTQTTGEFTFEPSDTKDGKKNFYIYIEDKAGGKFFTTASVENYLANPKLYVKGDALDEEKNASLFSYKSDSTNPVALLGEGLPYETETSEVAKDSKGNDFEFTSDDKNTENATLGASFIAGGISRRFVKFYFTANDASGVEKMTVEFKNAEGTSIKKLSTSEMEGFVPSGTFTPSSDDKSDAKWTTGLIDLDSVKTGQLSVALTPYDYAGLAGNGSFIFYVDNAPPSIEVTAPESAQELAGTISINGTAGDIGNAGTVNIQWIVPKKTDVSTYNSKKSEAAKLEYLKGLEWKGGKDALAEKHSVSNWQFDFDGNKNSKFDDYDSADYATNKDYSTTSLYYLPVYFMATDALGKYSVNTDFYLKHNPEGDKPKLEFTYPTVANYVSSEEKYAVLGGTIRAAGTAEIPLKSTTVNSVYYQIADSEAGFTESDSSTASTSYGYTVVKAYQVLNEILGCSYTEESQFTEEELKRYGFSSNNVAKAWWGIKATGAASWNFKLNERGELNPASGTTNIAIRVCGVNAEGKFGAWTSGDNVIAIHVDNTAPVITSAVNQYENGSAVITAVPENEPTASKTHESNMYLKGNWTFVATLLDETNVTSYSVFAGDTKLEAGTGYFVKDGVTAKVTNKDGTESTKNGVRLYIPIPKTPTKADSDSVEITVKASDVEHDTEQTFDFKIDETAPQLTNLTGNGTSFDSEDFTAIENKNYVFTLAGKATDDGSGVKNIVFYYMRKKGVTGTISEEVVIDPMITSSTTNAKIVMSGLTVLTLSQGEESFSLYAKACSGSATTDTFTASESESYDAHIRARGLIQIDGVLRTITKIDGKTVTFTPSLAAASDSITAYFPIAQVIDNSATEKVLEQSGKDFTFEKGDDGDGMPESFSKSGRTWTWDASVHSDNMPDGPVSLVILAFDEAGNVSGQTIHTKISNNVPRLAKVFFGTDLSGDGKYKNDSSLTEIVEYDILGAEGKEQTAYTLDFNATVSAENTTPKYPNGVFKIKNGLAVIPELTGGNGEVAMVLKTGAESATAVTGSVTKATSSSSETGTAGNISASFTGIVEGTFAGSNVSYKMHSFIVAKANLGSDGTNKGMSFTFWDSTEETTRGSNSQNAVLYVKNFTVAQDDTTKPTVVVNPFYWNSASENSLYDNSSDNGHIELEADWKNASGYKDSDTSGQYDGDPKVSGKITFTGTAYDNVRLGSIEASFASILKNATLASYDQTDGKWYIPSKEGTAPTMDGNGYEFSIVEATSDSVGNFEDSVYFDQKGHKVYWTLSIDTEKITNMVGSDIVLTVLAKDAKNNTTAASSIKAPVTTNGYTVTDGTTNKPTYQMDVVPYITGVTTKLSNLKKNNPSVYNRTARGHYSVASDETITFAGFNLGDTKTLAVSTLTASGAYDFAVTYTEKGAEVKVYALNNKNNNDAKGVYDKTVDLASSPTGSKSIYDNYYNRQPNGDNNNLLTDDVVIDVWQINSNVAQAQGSAYIAEPIMKINPVSGMLNFAYNSGPANFSMANGTTTSHTTWVGNLARMTTAGFAVDENGVTHGITVGLDTNPGSGSAGRMQYVTSKWGPVYSNRDKDKGTQENYEGTNSSRFETIGAPAGTYNGTTYDSFLFMEDRFASPSLATAIHKDESNVEHTYVFLAYYDDLNNEIRFRYGDLNDTTNHTIGRSFGGFQDAWVYGKGDTGDGNHKSFNTNTRPQDYSVIAASGVSGNYLSIDLIKGSTIDDDVIVATWQDSVAGNWYYAYKKKPCTDNDVGVAPAEGASTDGYWSTPILLASNAGEDCHISVDPRGGVHLAAYDASGANLLYAYLANYNASSHQIVTVDSYNFTGEHLTLDTALSSDGKYVIPFIGYYMSSAKKPKIAKLDNVIKASDGSGSIPSGVDSLDAVNGSWEVSVIPTESLYSENYAYSHVNVGVWKDSDGKLKKSTRPESGTANVDKWVGNNKAVGDETNGYFWGNGTDNPVLGYAIKVGTRGYIETAQMK